MNNRKKTFDKYFESEDLTNGEVFSFSIIKSLIRSILDPIASNNSKAVVFLRVKDLEETKGLIRRLEYNKNVILREFDDFEIEKHNIQDMGFVILTSQRYNCAFLYKEIENERYKIYFKINSKLINNVYETLKSIFLINYDKEFYEYKPERRENDLMNLALNNILKHFQETIKESEYSAKLQESYKNINETNTSLRNEIYQNVRQIAHEIKNQLSIMDIYTRIFEKKTGDTKSAEPIKKSIALIKSQIEQFKNFDVINLQERDVRQILKDIIKHYSGLLKEKNNKIVFIDEMMDIETNVFLDEEKFSIVISNIIKNASDCTNDDEIIIKLTKNNEKVDISIINHGEKIKDENKPKIFESGFTTKKDGWGVGLAVCKKYIGSQFGTFELTKSDEKETIFTVSLPLVQSREG